MRFGLAIVAAGVCVLLLGEQADARNKAEKKTIVTQAGSPGAHVRGQGRCWHRSSGGQLFVWSGGRWVPMAGDSAHAQSVPTVRTGDTSPATAGSRPSPVKPDVVNGLDWYLMGRGFTSD